MARRKYEQPSIRIIGSSFEQAAGVSCSPSGHQATIGGCIATGHKAGTDCAGGHQANSGVCTATGFHAVPGACMSGFQG